ncbi:MAG: hypothetical protein OSB34_12475, partial [Planktomarina sp.]|nr:hypothetical protein [Planktomarina sp.]
LKCTDCEKASGIFTKLFTAQLNKSSDETNKEPKSSATFYVVGNLNTLITIVSSAALFVCPWLAIGLDKLFLTTGRFTNSEACVSENHCWSGALNLYKT